MFAGAWILIFSLMLFHQGSAVLLDRDCAKDRDTARHTPWKALITTDISTCAGTLIDNQHVLTAASCVENATQTLVRLGDFTNPKPNSGMFEEYYVQMAMVHYAFNAKFYLNNIALLRLQRKVNYTLHIRPICLSLDANIGKSKKYSAFLLGNGNEGPKRIQIKRLHPTHCYDEFRTVPRNLQICGGSKKGTSCVETGSPLVKKIKIKGTSYIGLLGINSYGRSETCVYTDIMGYLQWILENVLDVEIVNQEI